MKLPILMTASVSTRGMRGADFSDSAREVMYLETLRFYSRNILARDDGRRIVFAENSGWDLARLQMSVPEEFRRRVEFVALDPGDFDISKGKGYNESILMTQAVRRSAAIRECGAFFKVTGRYPVFNLQRFAELADDFIGRGGRFYGDIKDHKLYDLAFYFSKKKWNGHAAFTVLFASRTDFYLERLAPLFVHCDDYHDRCIENVWFDELVQYRGRKGSGVSLRFPFEAVCGGLQGSTDSAVSFSKDNNSFKSRLKRVLGNAIRTFMPWFWF